MTRSNIQKICDMCIYLIKDNFSYKVLALFLSGRPVLFCIIKFLLWIEELKVCVVVLLLVVMSTNNNGNNDGSCN